MRRPNEFSPETKEKAFNRQKGMCAYCGIQLDKPAFILQRSGRKPDKRRKLTRAYAHHLRPITHGGGDKVDNCVFFCRVCHYYLGHGLVHRSMRDVLPEEEGSFDTWVKLKLSDLSYAYGE